MVTILEIPEFLSPKAIPKSSLMLHYFSTFRQHADPSVATVILQEDRSEQESIYILIKEENTYNPVLNLKLPMEYSFPFEDSKVFNDTVLIGWQDRFAIYNLNTKRSSIIALDGYFGSFTVHDDMIFVCSASDIICLSLTGEIKWRSASIAIDGIVINTFNNNIIYCSCEWDPPGGWQPYQVDMLTGITLKGA